MDVPFSLTEVSGEDTDSSRSGHPIDDVGSEDILESLSDKYTRRILRVIDDDPHTASEIAKATDIPLSTTYRKINRLVELGVLTEHVRLSNSGHHSHEYQRPVEAVCVSFDGEIEVNLKHHQE